MDDSHFGYITKLRKNVAHIVFPLKNMIQLLQGLWEYCNINQIFLSFIYFFS